MFSSFKKEIDHRSEEQSKFDVLKEKDRELNAEIKQINEEYKKQQDEFAKEAQESQEEIIRLKKSVNETKTDSELQRQYKKREIEGALLCVQRQNLRVEHEKKGEIDHMRETLINEAVVSDKIKRFIQKRKGVVEKHADERDRLKEKKIAVLVEEKEKIQGMKEQATHDTAELTAKCE